jgi:DNA repair exonuclease SbcCD ATPase subunit
VAEDVVILVPKIDFVRLESMRADPVGDQKPPVLELVFKNQPPEMSEDGSARDSINNSREAYLKEASRLLGAMEASLPGGLMDALLAAMQLRSASVYRVVLGRQRGPRCRECHSQILFPEEELVSTQAFCSRACESSWRADQDERAEEERAEELQALDEQLSAARRQLGELGQAIERKDSAISAAVRSLALETSELQSLKGQVRETLDAILSGKIHTAQDIGAELRGLRLAAAGI